MSIKFYIERRKCTDGRLNKENLPLIISVCYNGNRLKIYTGRKVDLDEWDKNTQSLNDIHVQAGFYNQYMKILKKEIQNIYNISVLKNEIPDTVIFKNAIKSLLQVPVSGFFETYLEFMESNYTKWRVCTYKKVKTLFNQLREFRSLNNYDLSLENIDKKFAEELVKFYRKKKLKDTTIRKNFDLLFWFMNWAAKNHRLLGNAYKNIVFCPEKTSTEMPVYLFWDELTRLYNLENLNRMESLVRDIYCFMAFTGIRYSEICRLLKSDANDKVIFISGPRAREIIQNKFSRNIYDKFGNKYYHDNLLFRRISIITFHKYLRSVASRAGLLRQVPGQNPSSGTINSKWYSIRDIISAESAINTYIANSLKLGIPSQVILRNVKGHSYKRQLLIMECIENSSVDQLKKFDLLFNNS
jgi:integrase